MFLYIRVALGYLWNFLNKLYNYVVKGRYMPDTEYNRQMFDYYLRVMMDPDVEAVAPAEVWQDMKVKNTCIDEFDLDEDEWKQVRQCVYAEAALDMLKLFWIKEDDI